MKPVVQLSLQWRVSGLSIFDRAERVRVVPFFAARSEERHPFPAPFPAPGVRVSGSGVRVLFEAHQVPRERTMLRLFGIQLLRRCEVTWREPRSDAFQVERSLWIGWKHLEFDILYQCSTQIHMVVHPKVDRTDPVFWVEICEIRSTIDITQSKVRGDLLPERMNGKALIGGTRACLFPKERIHT